MKNFSVNLCKEYSCLKLSKLEEIHCMEIMIWQPSRLLRSASLIGKNHSYLKC